MRMQTYVKGEKSFHLNRAILVYETGEQAVATLHPVHYHAQNGKEKTPTLGAGVPLDRETLLDIACKASGVAIGKERRLLPDNVLISDSEMLLWWLPSRRHRLFFKTGNKAFDAALNGREILQPALLFMARRDGLYLWALGKSERPQPSTRLWAAPYFNLYNSGHLCAGSFRYPDHLRVDGMGEWERGFFETNFSHTNMKMNELTTHPHGHNALWQEMLKSRAQSFPTKHLVPALTLKGEPKTVKDVIEV